jgi:outer membrane protein insertion porin family
MALVCRYVCRCRFAALAAALAFALTLNRAPPLAAQPAPAAGPPGEVVADVRVVGNQTVPLEKVVHYIKTRAGRPYDPLTVREDVRQLNKSRLFASVSTENLREPSGGLVVVFRVVERPVLQYIKYVGLRNALATVMAEETGLKVGQPVDPYAVSEGKRKIEDYYKGKGFNLVQVTILEGAKPSDRGAVYLINEGPQQQIVGFEFQGNTIVSGRRLKTQIMSGSAWFKYFGGFLDKEKVDGDVKLLEKYYKNLGFLTVRVGRYLDFNEEQTRCTVRFIIDEGPRCQISSLNFIGVSKFNVEDLQKELKLKPGEPFDGIKLLTDKATVEQIYGSYGYVFAKIQPEPRVSEDASRMDLVYVVDEGKRYRVGKINVKIEGESPHTNIRTVYNRLELKPGDVIDVRKLRRSEVRLKRSALFEVDPLKGRQPTISVRPIDALDSDEAIADSRSKSSSGGGSATSRPATPTSAASGGGFRGQSPDNWQPDDVAVDVYRHGGRDLFLLPPGTLPPSSSMPQGPAKAPWGAAQYNMPPAANYPNAHDFFPQGRPWAPSAPLGQP